mmetsp:Transcript_30255/g.73625  ORF Transcript_30255/g.73625 Transcript_30255/m.73625 type:complete len:80 (-) Transcript_30255:58-297(-)
MIDRATDSLSTSPDPAATAAAVTPINVEKTNVVVENFIVVLFLIAFGFWSVVVGEIYILCQCDGDDDDDGLLDPINFEG